ncbi:SsrA-binding protein SmpB [Marinicella gelatinilytica]|uniref:SsrA-binding protein SmpB n=1 Tax=Marinicella gelatinilytica TaxID=2996017 RepID=UPI002260A2A5|nr:SsrA-binding protein SmpB [Marinicella gelatinilytica]MCX7544579.1 SsrA-binding protein SmpB [Marinicella gelatinilytica]
MAKAKKSSNTIIVNKKASHEFHFIEEFEAGIELQGWEVKALRAGKVNLAESYVYIKQGEVFLTNCHITPLSTASTHIEPDSNRLKKLLLHKNEIDHLIGAVERKGLTLVARSLYWKKGKVKLKLILAQGKKLHDKRAASKEKDWNRQKQRILKEGRY